MTEKKQCEAEISDGTGWHCYQCTNNAKIEQDGRWYCGIHDPARREKRRKAKKEELEREWTVAEEKDRRRKAEIHYCENLETKYLETHKA